MTYKQYIQLLISSLVAKYIDVNLLINKPRQEIEITIFKRPNYYRRPSILSAVSCRRVTHSGIDRRQR